MVRFGARPHQHLNHYFLFQFQYGAIWRLHCLQGNAAEIPFQFQYGAIWSFNSNEGEQRYSRFQFQYGAIWRDGLEARQTLTHKFQFQYGAIWSSLRHALKVQSKQVSIPVWCDLEIVQRTMRMSRL